MKHSNFKKTIVSAFTFTVLYLTVFASSAKAGGDMYQIYLNDKLILKEFVIQPITLKKLAIDKANSNDNVVVYYSHCGTVGKGRSIAIKDTKGNVLKEWKFTDAANNSKGMVIPVKELLQLQKNSSNLTLYYTAQELPKGLTLASVHVGPKSTI
jgi:hypothetical protein